MYPASKSTVRPSCGRKNAMRAYGPRLFCASELCPVCASGPRPVCATWNMESAAHMIQIQRCFMIFPFKSSELLICGPDHPFADVFRDLGHRDKRATIVGHANGVRVLKPPQRGILRMDADGGRACSLQLRRDVRKDGIDEVMIGRLSAVSDGGTHNVPHAAH